MDRFKILEKFRLEIQINRAALSIPSNIAEEISGILTNNTSIFLNYTLGSAYELQTQVFIVSTLFPNLESANLLDNMI